MGRRAVAGECHAPGKPLARPGRIVPTLSSTCYKAVVVRLGKDLSRSYPERSVEGFEMTDGLICHFERSARNLSLSVYGSF
jgi:hypothetical protein